MKSVYLLLLLSISLNVLAQDAETIKTIYNIELAKGKSYEMLSYLSTKIGARLSGSPGAAAGVEWGRHTMESFDFDSVWLQPVMVPHLGAWPTRNSMHNEFKKNGQ